MVNLVYVIPVLLALGAASSGWMRIAARSYVPLLISLSALCLSAGGCWLIGSTKSGSYLSGIVGTLLAILMGIAAIGLLVGAMLRWLHEWLHLRIKHVPTSWRQPPTRAWDMMALVTISVLAIGLSIAE